MLTYEELTTLLCKIEAFLNSRPMYALSNDPLDLVAIILGNFLIVEPPVSIPAPTEPDDGCQGGYISHFRLVNNLRDHF